MPNIAISALPVATSQAGADVLPIVQATTSTTKQLSVTNLFTNSALVTPTLNSPTMTTPVLGIPASGTVTNLTGTASININGTVGATTATTGAFTTVTASGSVTSATIDNNALIANTTFATAATLGLVTLKRVGVIKGYVGLSSNEAGAALLDIAGAVRAEVNTNGFVVTGTSTSTGKMGYATGAGGTVTQATSKATGVTLSKSTGQITLNNAALAADTTVSFTLTNTVIEAGDILIMNHISAGTAGSYLLNAQSAAGTASINVRNITAGSLSEAIVIAFAVIKAVTA